MQVFIGRQPEAWGPIGCSLIAIGLVLIQLVKHGAAPEPDEGTTAHLWQLVMGAQLPIIAVFVYRWGRRFPGKTIAIMAIQIAFAATAAAIPIMMGW